MHGQFYENSIDTQKEIYFWFQNDFAFYHNTHISDAFPPRLNSVCC